MTRPKRRQSVVPEVGTILSSSPVVHVPPGSRTGLLTHGPEGRVFGRRRSRASGTPPRGPRHSHGPSSPRCEVSRGFLYALPVRPISGDFWWTHRSLSEEGRFLVSRLCRRRGTGQRTRPVEERFGVGCKSQFPSPCHGHRHSGDGGGTSFPFGTRVGPRRWTLSPSRGS